MITKIKFKKASILKARSNNKIAAISNDFDLTKTELRNINFFGYGIIIYTMGYIPTMSAVKAIEATTLQGIQLVGLVLLVTGAIGLIKLKFDDKYLETVFKIILIYGVITVIRGLKSDFNYIKSILFDPIYNIFTYLVPLVILFPRKLQLYKRLFSFLFIYGVMFIYFFSIFIEILMTPDWRNWEAQYDADTFFLYLAYPLTYTLVTYIYLTNPKKLFSFAVMFISLYLVIYRARRGALLMSVTTLLGILMVYLIYTKRTTLIIFLSVFFALFISLSMSNIKLPSMFNNLQQRADDDTRTGVELAMKADMKPIEWVFGKGFNGTYYCETVIDDPTNITFQRKVIETGYLQIILNGGWVNIILLGIIIFPAIYKGLFKSSNILCKGSAIFMLLWVFYTYPRIVTSFSMYYIIIWINVGICYSPKIRNLSDSTIKRYFQQ